MKTLSSRGVYIRPLVMVAPPFVPVCITPKCLASTREQRRSDPHDNSRDSSSSHIYMVELSLTDSSLTFATVGDGSSSFRSRVHYTKLSSTRERRRSYPHDNSRDSSSSHIWWRLDRLKVNPKYRLIIFLKKDLAGLTSRSEGVGDGDDGGDDGGGLLDFCENKNPISYQLIIVLSNFSIQSRIGVVFHFEHSISKIKSQNKVVFKLGCIQL